MQVGPTCKFNYNQCDYLTDLVNAFPEEEAVKEACEKVSNAMIELGKSRAAFLVNALQKVNTASKKLIDKIIPLCSLEQKNRFQSVFIQLRQNIFINFLRGKHEECSDEQLNDFEKLISDFDLTKPIGQKSYLIGLLAQSRCEKIRKLFYKCLDNSPIEAKNQALMGAISNNDDELITALLNEGASPNDVMEELFQQSPQLEVTTLKKIIPYIDDWCTKLGGFTIWYSLLRSCKASEAPEDVSSIRRLILDKLTDAQLNSGDEGKWAMEIACSQGDNDTLFYLIERGVEPFDREDLLSYIKKIEDIPAKTLSVLANRNLISLNSLEGLLKHEEKCSVLKQIWNMDSDDVERLIQIHQIMNSLVDKNCFFLEKASECITSLINTIKSTLPNCAILDLYAEYNEKLKEEFTIRKIALQNIAKSEKHLLTEYSKRSQNSTDIDLCSDIMQDLIRCFNEENIKFLFNDLTAEPNDKQLAQFMLDKNIELLSKLGYFGRHLDGFSPNLQLRFVIFALRNAFTEEKLTLDSHSSNILARMEKALMLCTLHGISGYSDPSTFSFDYPYLVATGSLTHAVLFCMEKGANDESLRLSLFNTGRGVNDHHPGISNSNKYQTVISYEVPRNQALNFANFVRIKEVNTDCDIAELYKLFNFWCRNCERVQIGDEYYEQVQLKGSCSAQCIMAFIRYYIIKNSIGSPLERVGLYKYLKLHLLKSMAVAPFSFDLTKHVDRKLKHVEQELNLFDIVADQAIQAGIANYANLTEPQSRYGYFAAARQLVKDFRLNPMLTIPEDLQALATIIESRREDQQKIHEFIIFRLNELLELDKNKSFQSSEVVAKSKLRIGLAAIFSIPSYQSVVLKWYNKNSKDIPKEILESMTRLPQMAKQFIDTL